MTNVGYPRAAAVLRQLADLIEAAPHDSDRDRFDQWLAEIRAGLAHQESLKQPSARRLHTAPLADFVRGRARHERPDY